MGTEDRSGQLLASKYRLERLLGSGGMGHVYRATNELIGRPVAIKTLRVEHAKNAEVVDRFLREARAANLVRHPNVVDVVDIGQDADGSPFIVQELLEGEDLSSYATRLGGRIPLNEVVELLCPVIDAVAEAHACSVVHRDIKPENVFLAREGGKRVPKLLDFGISKIRVANVRATEIGMTMGTPAYMPPEQLRGAKDADARSDVWSIGVMLFELIAGRLPFEAEDAPMLFVAVATRDAPKLIEVRADVPANLSRVVERCLRRDPDARYPSASELARDLRLVMSFSDIEPTGRFSLPPSLTEKGLVVDIPRAPALPAPAAPAQAPPVQPPASASSKTRPMGDAPSSGKTVPLVSAQGPAPTVRLDPAPAPGAARTVPLLDVPGPSKTVPHASVPDLATPSLTPRSPPASGANVPAAPDLDLPPPRAVVSRAPAPAPARAPAPAPAPAPARPVVSPPAGAPSSVRSMPAAGVAAPPVRGRASSPDLGMDRVSGARAAAGPMHAPMPASGEGPDVSGVVGLAVVALVVIFGMGGLMRFARTADGWAVAREVGLSADLAGPVQGAAALVCAILAVTRVRTGIRRWKEEGGQGRTMAIVNAVAAAGAFFAAIELARAAW